MRPVLPQDLELHGRFFDGLSKESRYNRFFNPMPTVPADTLERLIRVDHYSHLALIAETVLDGEETIIAEARFTVEPSGEYAEFAIAVADQFQRLGLGSLMLDRLVFAASRLGLARLLGETLATNDAMLRLARKAGFTLSSDPGHAYLVKLTKAVGSKDVHSLYHPHRVVARKVA